MKMKFPNPIEVESPYARTCTRCLPVAMGTKSLREITHMQCFYLLTTTTYESMCQRMVLSILWHSSAVRQKRHDGHLRILLTIWRVNDAIYLCHLPTM